MVNAWKIKFFLDVCYAKNNHIVNRSELNNGIFLIKQYKFVTIYCLAYRTNHYQMQKNKKNISICICLYN